MNPELKEAFKSEFYISTPTITPECKLWHSLGLHICPDGISIFNVDVDKILKNGGTAESLKDLKELLKHSGFKKVKNEEKFSAPANVHNYDVGIMIINDFDKKMDPETKKTRYE